MYRVTSDNQVLEQVAALPIKALASYAELLVVLETVPWNGDSLHKDNPDGAVRAHAFRRGGLVAYLILEDERRVDVLTVQWVGSSRRCAGCRKREPGVRWSTMWACATCSPTSTSEA